LARALDAEVGLAAVADDAAGTPAEATGTVSLRSLSLLIRLQPTEKEPAAKVTMAVGTAHEQTFIAIPSRWWTHDDTAIQHFTDDVRRGHFGRHLVLEAGGFLEPPCRSVT
jgi:hypothetical protein